MLKEIKSWSGNIILDFILLYSIIVDSINGYYQYFYKLHMPIGHLFRGVILLLMLYQILKRKVSKLPIAIGGLPIVFCVLYFIACVYWLFTDPHSSFEAEMSEYLKVLYSVTIVIYTYIYVKEISSRKIFYILYLLFVILGSFNIIAYVLDFGIPTYKAYNVGSKAFFVDGNSFAMYMVLLFVSSIIYILKYSNRWLSILSCIFGILGTLIIASRGAIIGVSAVLFILSILLLFRQYKDSQIKVSGRIFFISGILVIGFLGIIFLTQSTSVLKSRFTAGSIGSARSDLIEVGRKQYSQYTGIEFLIGSGRVRSTEKMAQLRNKFEERKSIESDFDDAILNFGWGLGGLFIMVHLAYYLSFIPWVMKYNKYLSVNMIYVGVSFWFVMCYFSGHGFSNTMLSPILAIFYLQIKNPDFILDRLN